MAITSRFHNSFLLLVLVTITWSINAVLSCQFGPGCLQECNCAVSCDSQTGCTGPCAAGWDGPTCQRQNVALNRPTTQSSTFNGVINYTSQYAVDGKVGHKAVATPCANTKNGTLELPATWSVTLDRVHRINRFQIYNRNESCGTDNPCGNRLAGFRLSVGNSSSQIYRTCYIDTTASGQNPGDIINRSCNQGGPLSGNIVQITGKTGNQLTLCEVLIYVCSVGSYGQDCGQLCGLCAQGRHFCDKISGNCPDRPGQPRCAAGYSGDKCKTMCSAGTYGQDCGQLCGLCAQGRHFCDKISGNCPDRPGQPRCAAGYFGDKCKTTVCSVGSYGKDCGKTCGLCAQGRNFCNNISGNCPDRQGQPRCAAGYSGDKCKTKCTDGMWGSDCLQKCGYCYNRNACNKSSGECPIDIRRCSSAFIGLKCNTFCKPGTYGSYCENSCGSCAQRQTFCYSTSGTCPDRPNLPRCMAGFHGLKCQTKCVNGTYGDDCQYECGFCAEGPGLCNVTSGDCPEIPGQATCIAGYTAPKCQTVKKADSTNCMGNYTAGFIGCAVGCIVGIIAGIAGHMLFLYRRQRISENERRHERTQRNDFVHDRPMRIEGNRTNQAYST